MWIGNFADVFNFGATTKAKLVLATANGTIFEFPSEFPCLDKNGYLAPELKTLLILMNNEVRTLDHDHIVTRNTVLAEQEKNAAQFEKVDAELKVVKDQNAMLIDKVDKVEAHLKADQGEIWARSGRDQGEIRPTAKPIRASLPASTPWSTR